MWQSGATKKGIFEAAGLFTGLAVSLHVMHQALTDGIGLLSGNAAKIGLLQNQIGKWLQPYLGNTLATKFAAVLNWMTTFKGILVITGGLVLLSWILSVVNAPSSEDTAAENLNEQIEPVVWSQGPVLMMTAGLALSSMGINLSPSAPLMQEVTVPQALVNSTMQAAGTAAPMDSTRYGSVFVQQGANGAPTRVVFLTPDSVSRNGTMMETVHEYTLQSNVKFTNPGSTTGFIPFFTKNAQGQTVPNQKVVQALDNQQGLLRGAAAAGTASGAQAGVTAAGTQATGGVTPNSGGL